MTAEDFRSALSRLGYSQAGFARWIGYDRRSVARFYAGTQPVPLVVQRYLTESVRPADPENRLRPEMQKSPPA